MKPTMMRSLKDLVGSPIEATDGGIGRCDDFLLDDKHWTVRYLVADTRKWLPGRQVLISPCQFGPLQEDGFRVNLTKEQIKECPPLDSDQPVSHQYEIEMARFYGNHLYWAGPAVWGYGAVPIAGGQPPVSPEEYERHSRELTQLARENQLRSVEEITGYTVMALDGEVGRVTDFVVESPSWTIRWIVVATKGLLTGKSVILSPEWISEVDWPKKQVTVDLVGERVRNSPDFDPREPVNRDYEGRLLDFYGRPRYW